MRKTYTVNARRAGSWWAIDVAELEGVFSQARRLDQVEEMAREAIALYLDVPAKSFDIRISAGLKDEARELVVKAVMAKINAAVAQAEASNVQREAVKKLADAGLTTRDVGDLLRISHQRVAQLQDSRPVEIKRLIVDANAVDEQGRIMLYEVKRGKRYVTQAEAVETVRDAVREPEWSHGFRQAACTSTSRRSKRRHSGRHASR